ncbi:hypothetical protein F4808DRAFT_436669 [Astrocystis sublimbata]|nr:hypothetical protein F4808DRAFT_436669 [Astrocystis sublimbata]
MSMSRYVDRDRRFFSLIVLLLARLIQDQFDIHENCLRRIIRFIAVHYSYDLFDVSSNMSRCVQMSQPPLIKDCCTIEYCGVVSMTLSIEVHIKPHLDRKCCSGVSAPN